MVQGSSIGSERRARTSNELLSELRGTKGLRPKLDPGLAGGLRAYLEDGIYELLGAGQEGPLSVSARSFAPPAAKGSRGVLRGALVAQLVRLRVVGVDI